MLIEQVRMEKDTRAQQCDVIGDVKTFESKLSAKAKEHMCEGHEEKKNDDDRNETEKENEWLQPKKGVSMKRVCEMQGMKENKNKNNNNHKELSFDEEKDEDEEFCTMLNDNKSSTVATNDKKHESKEIERHAD